jgi:GDSL-like lipase/acylhydrolase family protein
MPRLGLLSISFVAVVSACSDSAVAPVRVGANDPTLQESEGRGVFQRYVAIGTSVSMGVVSDGVFAGSQVSSWPAQLARMGNREITQPYIQAPGCHAPIAAPLGAGVRTSGEPILADPATLVCAPLEPGVTLPTQNVAINGARAFDVLFTTPENTQDPGNRALISRVLAPGETQLTAMEAQNPKLVSVELGANEIFNARAGVVIVGAPPLPIENPATFAAQYDEILDRIEAARTKYVLLVGLPSNLFSVPGFRSGAEIAANGPLMLAAFNVAVQPDCATTNAANQIYVTIKVALAAQAGLAARAANQGPVPFTCAGAGPTTADFVLTPSEQAILTTVAAQMNAAMQAEAQARGFAYITLDALFAAPGVRTPFNAVALMTAPQPFGPYLGLDGLHPSAAGQSLIAAAAAQALNAKYDLGIPAP